MLAMLPLAYSLFRAANRVPVGSDKSSYDTVVTAMPIATRFVAFITQWLWSNQRSPLIQSRC